jgi:GTP1/Obg family GTP-binding protein
MSFIRKAPEIPQNQRTIDVLFDRQEELHQAEKKRKAEAAQLARIAKMKALAEYEPQMWPEIDRLLKSYTPKVYDEVTSQLVQLKQLTEYQGKQGVFQTRMP